jgi:hypothetical protein
MGMMRKIKGEALKKTHMDRVSTGHIETTWPICRAGK